MFNKFELIVTGLEKAVVTFDAVRSMSCISATLTGSLT